MVYTVSVNRFQRKEIDCRDWVGLNLVGLYWVWLDWIGLDWVALDIYSFFKICRICIGNQRRKNIDQNPDLRQVWVKCSHLRGRQSCIRRCDWKSLLFDTDQLWPPQRGWPCSLLGASFHSISYVHSPHKTALHCLHLSYVTELPEGKDYFLPVSSIVPGTK